MCIPQGYPVIHACSTAPFTAARNTRLSLPLPCRAREAGVGVGGAGEVLNSEAAARILPPVALGEAPWGCGRYVTRLLWSV
ncbi:hypothetical protein E2C01_078828 [Portunus trituberculatus]|uniref:Uncharacterized protein n=1 Tax=Portunus trituberculatus TaxID=210409 RepID=A0A5B7IJW2_PORTR|nr:hypothetical protein [Portunus trituberculatus]